MNYSETDFDVAIIGGGPAGAAMGAYLAKAGARCVVLEREIFPRPHVGESLVPSSTRVFKELDFLQKMEDAKFPHKLGAVWTSTTSKAQAMHDWDDLRPHDHAEIRFQERDQPGVDMKYTYHVDRGKFDLMLLQHAHDLGATVYEGIRVTGVDFNHGGNPEVQFTMGRKTMGVSAKIVIDASGRHTVLGNQLRIKVRDPVFDQYAIHTWFENFDRGAVAKSSTLGDYIFVHFLPIQNSWIWQIPITDSVTSLGVVTQKKNFAKTKETREKFFWDTVGSRPELLENMRRATQLRPLKDEGDYSYAMKQLTGDRFVLIGDAGRFVDPIFSTGVSIALNSARFACKDVLAALASGNYGRESYQTFETTIHRGTKNWYDFITVYYRLNILFTYYINNPEYRLDVLKLLQGDVYDEEQPEVLRKMKAAVTEAEQNPKHIWHALLNDLTANAFSPEV